MDYEKLIKYQFKTNSKDILKNDIFIAIGKGSLYIKEALEKKCKYVITESDYNHKKVINVESINDFLYNLSSFIRNKYKVPLIAVTGSCGKTTTKEFIYELLSLKYNTLKSLKNKNNHVGVPLSLLKLNKTHEIVVLEMGMNHLGEISYLSKLSKPDCAVITNIGTAHIGNLGSKKEILKAKLEILDGMNGGILIVNENDKYLNKVKNNKITILKNKVKVKQVKFNKDNTSFNLLYNNVEYPVIFNVPGRHIFTDLLLSINVALLYDVNISEIIKKIPSLTILDGRFKIYKKDITLIDDSYNCSYESLKESLIFLQAYENKKIIILSDMLELGKFSDVYHKKINKYINKLKNKEVYLYGNSTKNINGTHFETKEELFNNLDIKKGDLVFVKGSNSTKIYELSNKIKETFDL